MTKFLIASLIMIGTLSGCTAHYHPVRPHGKVVLVEPHHVHTARCGHYRHGNTWYFVKGHVHGPRCGHVLVSGVWVVR